MANTAETINLEKPRQRPSKYQFVGRGHDFGDDLLGDRMGLYQSLNGAGQN
jgi:hypothetical protein